MSIIKPTDEMHGAAMRTDGNMYKIVDDVIEIIEQNYIVQPRCPEQLSPDLRCNMRAGHGLRHRTKGTNGSEIFFENLVDNSTDVG